MNRKNDFEFHYRCAPLSVNHLIFCDDLMLFSRGDVQSTMLLKRTLKGFAETSGLEASNEKTATYFGNVPENTQTSVQCTAT